MVKKPARSTVTSTVILRGIEQLQNKLLNLRALRHSVKDQRKLVPEAVKILEGMYQERGEHTDAIYQGLMRFVELEIEAEWAEYLKCFRKEQDQGNGKIAAAWPEEQA